MPSTARPGQPAECGKCSGHFFYWGEDEWHCLYCGWYDPVRPKSVIDTIEEALDRPQGRGRPQRRW